MEINFNINKVTYNFFREGVSEEKAEVEIISKFGTVKDDTSIRAFFFEININAVNKELKPTRNFLMDISFNYTLNGCKDGTPNEQDAKYYRKCLDLINEKVILYTSQDGRTPFDITKAIEEFNMSEK